MMTFTKQCVDSSFSRGYYELIMVKSKAQSVLVRKLVAAKRNLIFQIYFLKNFAYKYFDANSTTRLKRDMSKRKKITTMRTCPLKKKSMTAIEENNPNTKKRCLKQMDQYYEYTDKCSETDGQIL